ncbi:helicase SNF2 [Streptomyces cinereoruber]|uniref:Helicase SNF2 n=1 Tax=Streptomyces cinereoruber TaxID=67260 RepID=A0AAV4KF08_9ACTN|nr:superfamily II DNA or RNA helicase [Streptomyces cinereoruber]NIH63666.1 superfamily II DNA or RNA helicase [Streptomyces cinereoruber]GGR11855.1 helicase SNF2 [Streptomyces cinereoruber]
MSLSHGPDDSAREPARKLFRHSAVFLPADPPRAGRIAFWSPDGEPLPDPSGAPAAGTALTTVGGPMAVDELTVVDEDTLRPVTVHARVLSVRAALPLLVRARFSEGASPAAAFWGAAGLLALDLVARGLLLPGLTPGDHDAWRAGPLGPEELERLRTLAASMPPTAHAVPLPLASPGAPPLLPEPEALLRAFADAVADTLPRTPAAPSAAGGAAFAAEEPGTFPEQRAWAADVAAVHDAGVRLSLRLELPGFTAESEEAPGFRAVLQLHGVADPALVADAAEVWSGSGPVGAAFGPRARMDALLALRRAARAWPPLSPLLSAAVPDTVELADEEVAELMGPAADALATLGVQVHWPRELADRLTARVEIGPHAPGTDTDTGAAHTDVHANAHTGADTDTDVGARTGAGASSLPALLAADSLLAFNWRFAVGEHELSRAELDRLAEAGRPLVRLRDRWVLVDPAEVRRARTHQDHKVTPVDALSAVLTGTTEVDGRTVEVAATGPLERLRERLAHPEDGRPEVAQPAALAATLRDYQLRGLDWLHRMTSLGLGGCLADDMGLGKTITVIALHLHRQTDPASAGPTLVVCPTSLMGNWQREIEKFAPGTPVRRFHGTTRDLEGLPDGGFVLTTYGTMRLDAERLAGRDWGLVVADEAQHVKNPYSATARRLRTIGARARVALSGTPVENNLSELWAILDWTTPGLLGTLGAFRARFAAAVEGGGDPAAAARLAALVRPFLLRRRKSDPGIAPELPPKTETDRTVSLTPEQTGLYEAVVRETLAAISAADGMARRGLVVKLLTGLKQICNHPAQYLKEEGPRIEGRSGKLELLDELLDTILAEGAATLVFTQYVGMARLLEAHLAARGVRTQFLHGGTPVAEREAMVARFQDGEVPVFLLSLKAAGTGLNLTRAEHVVHYDRWWNPAVEAQATDRAYRIGQDRPVQVHRLIAEGTIEDRIAAMLDRKRELADSVLGTGGDMPPELTELTDAELAELVRLRGDGR